MRRISSVVLFIALVFAVSFGQIPAPTGYVNDYAKVIPPNIRTNLEQQLRSFEKATSIEIAVLTVDDIGQQY